MDKAATIADVRDKMNQAEADFPDGAEQYSINEINFSEFPILVISVSGAIPERELLRTVKSLQDDIEALPPILEAGLAGARDEMLEVLIDPLRLEAYNVTAGELINVVSNNNLLIAAGEVEGDTGAFSVKIPSAFDEPRDVYELPVKVNGDRVVTLGDLAEIRLTFEDQAGTARYNGETTLALQVVKRKGFNVIDTAALVRTPGCPMPRDWDNYHDLADFWADHLENTNCTAGWVAKNFLGLANESLNCNPLSHEGGWLPRLHDVAVPFDPVDPSDHFPEHFQVGAGDYANGQVAAAALWQVRLGMRSRNRIGGHSLFWRYFTRALRFTGFYTPSAPGTHRDLYEQLYELEVQMMQEWTWNAQVGSTSNKLQTGFARAGLFLIPPDCLDDNPLTTDAHYCPGGTNGGAAVIDVDDNDPADDLILDGVTHRETDYLEIGGAIPSFDVWTGPRWHLTGNSALPISPPALCNKKYWVTLSTDPQFDPGQSIQSGWLTVDTDVTTPATPECYARWTPPLLSWNWLAGGKPAGTRIYYRVLTIDGTGGNLMSSDQPGKAMWQPPSPYAVLTTDGRFARFRSALGISSPGGSGGSGR